MTGACKASCTAMCNSILNQATADCVQTSIPGYFDRLKGHLTCAGGQLKMSEGCDVPACVSDQ